MPKYAYAKPFDIIREILQMKKDIKSLQINAPIAYVPWTEVAYQNSWVAATGAGIVYRPVADNGIWITGRATVPSGFTSGSIIALLNVGTNFRTEYHTAVFYNTSSSETACMIALTPSGQLFAYGAMAVGNTLVVSARISVDAPAVP